MPWTPAETLLTTTDENKNLSYSITYVPDAGEPDPVTGEVPVAAPAVVTVSAINLNKTITVGDNTIRGYFSDAFDYTVNYIDIERTDYTVPKFSAIDPFKLHELYKYTPNMDNSVTYNYLATARDSVTNAVVATQTYSIVVTQNWTINKNLLKRYVNFDNYFATYVLKWINQKNVEVAMLNNLDKPVYWEKT